MPFQLTKISAYASTFMLLLLVLVLANTGHTIAATAALVAAVLVFAGLILQDIAAFSRARVQEPKDTAQ